MICVLKNFGSQTVCLTWSLLYSYFGKRNSILYTCTHQKYKLTCILDMNIGGLVLKNLAMLTNGSRIEIFLQREKMGKNS